MVEAAAVYMKRPARSEQRAANDQVEIDVGRQEQHGIDAIENAAVAGQQRARVLDAGRALEQ
jgi:hypothetical protein